MRVLIILNTSIELQMEGEEREISYPCMMEIQ
jgi:hypothetical protein